MWFPLAKELVARHTVVIPDLRGAGGSSKPDAGYDKKTMAQDVHAISGQLGIRHGRRHRARHWG